MDCVADGAGEAAVLRSWKRFFNHLRFPVSFTGMASMRTFGGKRCYRTSDTDSQGKLTAVCSRDAGKTDRCGWLAWLPMSPTRQLWRRHESWRTILMIVIYLMITIVPTR
jgi:hypothetical protein